MPSHNTLKGCLHNVKALLRTPCVFLELTHYPVLCRLSQQLNALTEDAARMPANKQGAAEDMSGLVDGIMHQLLAKDVLYQPIQEIGSRYPEWLEEHRYDTNLHPVGFSALPSNIWCHV